MTRQVPLHSKPAARARPLTVSQLREALAGLADDLPVVALHDYGCAGGDVIRAEPGPNPEDNTEAAVLIIE